MKTIKLFHPAIALLIALHFVGNAAGAEEPALKDVFKNDFLIGGAFNRNLVTGNDPGAAAIAEKHLNTATSENDMKWSSAWIYDKPVMLKHNPS